MAATVRVDERQNVHAEATLPMARARICVLCENVCDCSFPSCPRCGGWLAQLAWWLGGILAGQP